MTQRPPREISSDVAGLNIDRRQASGLERAGGRLRGPRLGCLAAGLSGMGVVDAEVEVDQVATYELLDPRLNHSINVGYRITSSAAALKALQLFAAPRPLMSTGTKAGEGVARATHSAKRIPDLLESNALEVLQIDRGKFRNALGHQ